MLKALGGTDQRVQSRAVSALLVQVRPGRIHCVRANSGTYAEGTRMAQETVVALWERLRYSTFKLHADTRLSTWCTREA